MPIFREEITLPCLFFGKIYPNHAYFFFNSILAMLIKQARSQRGGEDLPPAPKYFQEIVPRLQIFPLNCAPVANISQKLCPHRIISHGIRTELCPWTTKPPLPPKKLATGLVETKPLWFSFNVSPTKIVSRNTV